MSYEQIIPWTISAIMLVFAIMTFVTNKTKMQTEKDSESRKIIDAVKEEFANQLSGVKESNIKFNIKMDQVCATTNETRTDIKTMNKSLIDLDKRITIVERDIETAFEEINNLKGGK